MLQLCAATGVNPGACVLPCSCLQQQLLLMHERSRHDLHVDILICPLQIERRGIAGRSTHVRSCSLWSALGPQYTLSAHAACHSGRSAEASGNAINVVKAMALRALSGSVDVRQNLVPGVFDIYMFLYHGCREGYLDGLGGAKSSRLNHRYRRAKSTVDIAVRYISREPPVDFYGCVQTARLICVNGYSKNSGRSKKSFG